MNNPLFNSLHFLLGAAFLAFLPSPLSKSSPSVSVDWTFSKEVEGIRIYHRQSGNSQVKELKINFTVNAGLQPILAVLRDIDAFPDWIYNCAEARLLDGNGQKIIYYHRIDFPWPLSDRDAVSLATYKQDPQTGIVYSVNRAMEGLVPDQDGVIRLSDMEIRWVVTPVETGESKVDYYLRTDPGGSLPAWLINLAIDKGPVKSMKAFRDLVSKEKYTRAQVDGIVEFFEHPSRH